MEEGKISGAEPEYGKWTKEQLIGLVVLELEKVPPRNYSEVTRMGMHYAKRTGASYPWLCSIIETLMSDHPRSG